MVAAITYVAGAALFFALVALIIAIVAVVAAYNNDVFTVKSQNGFQGTFNKNELSLGTSANGILKANTNALESATAQDITNQLLTGYVSGPGIVSDTDSLLQGVNKLNGNSDQILENINQIHNQTNALAPAGQRDFYQASTGALGGFMRRISDVQIFADVISRSTDGGITFSPTVFDVSATGSKDIAFGNGIYVTVSSTSQSYISTDGVNFVLQASLPFPSGVIHFFAGLFIAGIDDSTNKIMTSPDGLTWTLRPSSMIAWDFVSNDDICVAVSQDTAPFSMYSTDGITWTNTVSTILATRSVAWSPEKQEWLMNAYTNTTGFTSKDGITWTSVGAIFPATAGNVNIMWVADNINLWYLMALDTNNNYSLWSSPDSSQVFLGTHLDGAIIATGTVSNLYLPSYNRFLLATAETPYVFYGTPRPLDIKALGDNIRVRGAPVSTGQYSVYDDVKCDLTLTETDISTSANAIGSRFFQSSQPLGMVMNIDMNALVTSIAGDTLTLRVYGGATGTALLYTHIITVPALSSNLNISMLSNLTVRATTIQVNSKDSVNAAIVTGTPAYTRTIGNLIKITSQWGANINELTMNQLVIRSEFRNGA